MSGRKINLDEIAANIFPKDEESGFQYNSFSNTFQTLMKKAMKEAINQALELAAENAEPELVDYSSTSKNKINIISVNKQSILRTIDQIE